MHRSFEDDLGMFIGVLSSGSGSNKSSMSFDLVGVMYNSR